MALPRARVGELSTAGSPSREYDHLLKFLLVGDQCVGKSNVLLRFVDDVYKLSSEATVGIDFRICSRTIGSEVVKMQLWDTAGQERFRTITPSFYRGAHGIIVVYDVTDRESFNNVRAWMQETAKYAKEGTCRFLIGNKCDLREKRVVSYDEGKELAADLGIDFLETSARLAHNIDTVFERLCDEALAQKQASLRQQPDPEPSPRRRGWRLRGKGDAYGDRSAAPCCQ